MDPRDIRELLLPEIEEEILLVAVGYRMEKIGNVFASLCEYFQALGICDLLENADVGGFRENLVRSGYARRYFLRKSLEEGNDRDRHLSLGWTEALLDSVAAGHLRLARDIINLSIETWEASWEYEDDFCFHQFLQHALINPDHLSNPELEGILARFERALEGGKSLRLEVCKALTSRKAKNFSTILNELMLEKQNLYDEQRERMLQPRPSTYLFWPRSFVSVEGLALIKIAEVVGMKIEDDFPLCPRMGRLSTTDQDYTDIFEVIELERARSQ